MLLLENKIALVTGAASGLGKTSALAFSRAGAKVAVVDIEVQKGEQTVAMIKKNGGEAVFIKADVSLESDVRGMMEEIIRKYKRLDCAHNNAGIAFNGPFINMTESQWDQLLGTNLKGVWLCMKYELLQMSKQKSGAIVNTSSVAGLIGTPESSLYVASKWGVNGLTKAGAIEYARSGIRVNSVCPAGMRGTGMWLNTLKNSPELSAKLAEAVPMGRDSEPEEVAEAVVWLCSDLASFVTGINMPVDGGMSSS